MGCVGHELKRRGARAALLSCLALAAALGAPAGAAATSFTPGDVVVYRVGNGAEALTGSATSAWLDEFEPAGSLAATVGFPTAASLPNRSLVASGSASSEGLLTLSANGQFLLGTGYASSVGTASVAETKASTIARVVGRVSATGVVNTETALSDFADKNNPRSAASSDGTKIWVAGAAGGVRATTLGSTSSTILNTTATNVRQVEIVGGQLYVSADPTKAGAVSIAKVGSGLPTTGGQTIANLPFETAPEQPFAYSLLTLGLGSTPDTAYVADNKLGGVSKYSLTGGKWVRKGTVEIPFVTGVTANDVGGVVTIYATTSGEKGRTGALYKIPDVSGAGGTLSGVPAEISTAPLNEAYRGVAFAPGTVIGSGGTPPSAPTITAAENTLAAALGDPTNQPLAVTVGDNTYSASELKLTAHSSNQGVAPDNAISITGTGASRSVSVNPAEAGTSKLTLTVEAPDGSFASTQVKYGASAYQGDPSDRYYEGAGNGSTAIDVGGGYVIVGDDESNVLHLYRTRTSGEPAKSFDFTSQIPFGASEIDIEASARAGSTLYWLGSLSNKHNGELQPNRDVLFAATISGSGAGTELTYLGSYTHLREDLIEWDDANGKPLGLAKSAEAGQPSDLPSGFNVEGLEFAAGSSEEAYVAFRAPLEPPGENRQLALVVPVTNFASLVTNGNPGSTKATFGTALQWNLGGLAIREIRRNADGEYLVIAGTADESNSSFRVYGWDGEPEDEPVPLNAAFALVAEGAWEGIHSTLDPIVNGGQAELIEDNGDTAWYLNNETTKKGLAAGLQKDLGRLFTVQIPPPGVPGAPTLASGGNPNAGQFTLRWKPAATLRARFKLEHENAQGSSSTVASSLARREYTFTSGAREAEGTWTYRVSESNESGEAGPSSASEAIKVDRTAPDAPTPKATRGPDYAGGGGWYKDSATVSFSANGDPVLADGSSPSGVDPASLTAPETFTTSGTHTASGTVADHAGNVSAPATLVVQVDATAPSLEIQCPATALVGEEGVSATVLAGDAESGLASDPSGSVPISTAAAGPVTVTRTATDNVGHQTTTSCTTQVHYPTPGAPALTAGASPNGNGLFTLGWSGADPLRYLGLSYALEHHDAAGESWSTVASGIEALSYEFSGEGEAEGTWAYRVQGSDPGRGQTTDYSPASSPVVVDRTPPNSPTAKATRPADYAGGGGWYKDSARVAFSADGDPALSDGSPGSGVDSSSLTPPETFTTSGSHTASGTVADRVGNLSAPATLTVQVDATAPSVEVQCPASAFVGESGVTATVSASDSESGLASDPSGSVHIGTTHAGPVTVTRTAVDNVEHETTRSCTTQIHYPTPGAPSLSGGRTPNSNGLFTLSWSGADPLQYSGLSYTLQHHDASTESWSTVASGIEELSYPFMGAGEHEGTWVYRVQGTDPGHGETTAYSPASSAVVVDRTPPNAPTAKATRGPDYAGGGGWYQDSATVAFSANGDPALSDGSPGSGVEASSLSAPETFATSGSHTGSGTVADRAGNVSAPGSAVVHVDATAPSLEIECPETGVVGETGATATVRAADAESGLARDPSGSAPIDTSQAGPATTTRTAIDNVGHETTRSCTTQLHYPTPGAPVLTAGTNPNATGLFKLGWSGTDPMTSLGLSYTLQHHDAATETWSLVASGIEALSYEFTGAGEHEGTWVYRVQGSDPGRGQTTPYSRASAPVVVDRTPPNTPTAKASHTPDYAGGGGWYKDRVTVSFTSHGDPELQDGSPGSGVEAGSLSAPQTFEASGSHVASGTVADKAGNVSAPGTLTVQVDATPPSLEVKCPATAVVGEGGVTATVTASDGESGLASDPSGTVPINTEHAGPQTVTRTAIDNVGHETTRSCTTQVRESPPEFGRCEAVPGEKVGSKTVYHGRFTSSSCVIENAAQTSPYEWVSGVLRKGFRTAIEPTTTAYFETTRKTKVTCAGASSSGLITSAKTVGSVVMRFTECHVGEEECTTPGKRGGELETRKLEGVLGIERVVKEKPIAALDLYPVGKSGTFLEYTCGIRGTTTLTGSLIGSQPTGKMFTFKRVKYNESSGRQKPESFKGGEQDVLLNNHGEQVGLAYTATETFEERLEINALF